MSAQDTKKVSRKKKSLIDPLYTKLMKSVIRSIGSSEFYEFFMDTMSRADSEIQFSNRKVDKVVDVKWVEAIEGTVGAMQSIVASPRNIIREDELIVNVAHARKAGSDVVRHLAQHGQLVEDFNEETGDVRPGRLMQKYREDSEDLYENRLAFTTIEMAYRFVDIRYNALFEALGDEFGAKLRVETNFETAIEELHCDMFMHIKQKDSALDVDEKNGDILSRIERLHRLLTSFMNSPYGQQMARLNRVRGNIVKTNVLKKNPNYRKLTDLYDFLRNYDDVGYVIKVTEQNPSMDETFVTNVFHNVLFQYIVLKGYLEDEKDRQLPTPLKQKKRKLKPKVIKEIIEELTEDYDVPDLEIRKVLIEELTREQLMLEEEAERRRLVEEQEERKRKDEEYRKQLEEQEQERLRKEQEAEEERKRLEEEEIARQEKVRELEQKLEDERRKNIFNVEIEYFKNHLYDHLDMRSQLVELMKDSEEVQDYSDAAVELEKAEIAKIQAIEAEAERVRVEEEAKQSTKDNKAVNPYLEELRNFESKFSFRQQLRNDYLAEQARYEAMLKEEKQKRLQQQKPKKRGLFG